MEKYLTKYRFARFDKLKQQHHPGKRNTFKKHTKPAKHLVKKHTLKHKSAKPKSAKHE